MPNYRVIPSIDQLRQRPEIAALERVHGSRATLDALRAETQALRAAIESGAAPDAADAIIELERSVADRLQRQFGGSLRPVINATGVVIHTNLGRAPLAEAAVERIRAVASCYTNLEYDLAAGTRGSRRLHAEALICTLTSAEAALVVNNNAAAVLLVLAALARGREVIVSRGELVEIGGGFRVPDVMAQSGALLREVGTTNRTRIADYRAAVHDRTALFLRVHRSNFRLEGFTEQPSLDELAAAAHGAGLPIVEDLGSGSLADDFGAEPSVRASIAAGIDLVCFSGDKMLGGPQAGIIVGRKALVDDISRHPLMRALRVDKLTLAALEGTLLEYLAGRAGSTVPVVRMIRTAPGQIASRARVLADRLAAAGWSTTLLDGTSAIGGGSAPGVELPTTLVALARSGLEAGTLEARLRTLDPPVIARIDAGRLVLDLRTVSEDQDELLASTLEGLRLEA